MGARACELEPSIPSTIATAIAINFDTDIYIYISIVTSTPWRLQHPLTIAHCDTGYLIQIEAVLSGEEIPRTYQILLIMLP